MGYIGSDDGTYARGAYGWIESFPYVGGHGTIRHTITIPIALSFLAFGENEFALVLPTLLYAVALIFVCSLFTYNITGKALTFIALLLIATHPNFVLWSSIVSSDIPEALFIFLSLYLFIEGLKNSNRQLLFWSGACAGLGFITRETTVFLLVTYGVLFLAGFGQKRLEYFVMAAGFITIWLLEVLYLTIMTGDPLYRLNISANHDSTIDRGIDLAGNIIIHPAIDPLLTILFNQEFGILFWLGIPLAIILAFQTRRATKEERLFLVPILLLTTMWFLCTGAAYSLLPLNPRYFLVSGIGICIVIAFQITRMKFSSRHIVPAAIGLLIATNMIGIYLDNRQHMFAERKLAEISKSYNETIFTDTRTARKSLLLLQWANEEDYVRTDIVEPGNLVYQNLVPSRGLLIQDKDLGKYLEANGLRLKKLSEYNPNPRWLGRMMVNLKLDTIIPQAIMSRIYRGHPGAILYEVVPKNE